MSKRSASEYLNNDKLWDTIDRYDNFDELDQDLDSNTISKISNLVNYIFNTEVTGFEVEMDKYKDRRNGNNTLSFGVKRDKTPHWFQITLTALKDEYFKVYVKLPFMSDAAKQLGSLGFFPENKFSITEKNFLIDGWDGLKELASIIQIAKGGCDFIEILSLPVPDLKDMQQERYSDYDMIKKVESKYPSLTIDDKTYYFKKVDNKFVPYGASIRYSDTLYIYKNEEEKAEQKRLKTEHDRLYNIYFNLRFRGNKTRMENDLTQEEDRMLMRLLNNSSLRGPVEGSYDTFKNEEDHQTALKLVDKLVKTSRPITETKTEGLKYLKVFKRF